MYLHFKDFRYAQDKQLLYKAGELIPLKRNQTALIDFFLADTESIHSKDTILNAVWRDQIVSEQVIFQTVSQLRTILGSESIKTFPKKGYKWELEISTSATDCSTETPNVKSEKESNLETRHYRSNIIWPALGLLALLIMFTAVIQRESIDSGQVKVRLLSPVKQDRTFTINLAEQNGFLSSRFSLQSAEQDMSVRQAFSSPKRTVKQLDLASDEWLYWEERFESRQMVVLHYGFSSQTRHWQGYVQAETNELLIDVLSLRLQQLFKQGLFESTASTWSISQIKALLTEWPEDPDLLLLAANMHRRMDQVDIALSYLQRLTRVASTGELSPYQALAHLNIGQIYKMRGHYEQAHNSLGSMAAALDQLPLGPLHFQYIKTRAWLAFGLADHESMYEILEQGFAYFSEPNGDQLLIKFKLHILNSILAQKVADHELKHHHLSQAQALLVEHELDKSNYAIVYYHQALFSQMKERQAEKESITSIDTFVLNLEKILTLPRTLDNFWVLDEAIELLVNHHIDGNDFVSAEAVLNGKSATPKRLFLKANILLAQNQVSQADKILEQAFEQAKIDYDSRTAIESALALYQLSVNSPKRQAEYLAYLESNAKSHWLKKKLVSANR